MTTQTGLLIYASTAITITYITISISRFIIISFTDCAIRRRRTLKASINITTNTLTILEIVVDEDCKIASYASILVYAF